MCKEDIVDCLPSLKPPSGVCKGCALGEHHRESFEKGKAHHSTKLLELIHYDLCGPMATTLIGKSRYVLIFTDGLSRRLLIYFFKYKIEVLDHFIDFKTLVENQSSKPIKIKMENGGKYINHEFEAFGHEHGILNQLIIPYTPQQNRVE